MSQIPISPVKIGAAECSNLRWQDTVIHLNDINRVWNWCLSAQVGDAIIAIIVHEFHCEFSPKKLDMLEETRLKTQFVLNGMLRGFDQRI